MSYRGPANEYFSPGFRKFLEVISPSSRRKEISFPAGCHEIRCGRKEPVQEWFKRVADAKLQGNPSKCQIEETMGVFAHLSYQGGLITYANVQVVVAEQDLETFYLDPATPCRYFRLDYDLKCLGEAFYKEPMPHIHVEPEGPPRFSALFSRRGNIILDFFDFIYRSYHYNIWRDWAQTAAGTYGISVQQFKMIEDAFAKNQHQALIDDGGVERIKEACRKLKDRLFNPVVDIKVCSLLSYDS
jgi:hypothetical protein